MKRYYDIVRLENQGPDQEDFETVKRMVDRGWVNKVRDFLAQWDYGDENLATETSYGRVRDTVTEEKSDTVIRTFPFRDGSAYHLCRAKDLVYEAYYLVGETE